MQPILERFADIPIDERRDITDMYQQELEDQYGIDIEILERIVLEEIPDFTGGITD